MRRDIDLSLVDGDVITYLAGYGAERVRYELYLNDLEVERGHPALVSNSMKEIQAAAADMEEYVISRKQDVDPMEYSLHKAKLILEKVAAHTGAKDMEVYLSNGDNFRDSIATYKKYKGNRDLSKKPVWYDALRDYMVKHWSANLVSGQEADDAIGIRQVHCQHEGKLSVVCSIDKDLLQIPGMHYDLNKETTVVQSIADSDRVFYTQCVTGDATDNITGCPSAGPKAAEKFLDWSAPWDSIVRLYDQYLSKKLPEGMERVGDSLSYQHWDGTSTVVKTIEEFALEQARLVYIRRYNNNEMWSP